jgi:tetratricopeptide (TPR) repeat protein
VSVQGSVEVKRVDATQWQPVTLNDTFCTGDRIRVGDRSRADVALANQPVLRLDQNTAIILGGIQKEQTFLVDLVQGATYFFSRATRALDVRTAFVNAGVEGTEGLIRVGDNRTEITIFEGKVVAANDVGTLSLTGGESAVAISGQAPAYRTIVKPRDAVQWALYYPPVMDVPPDDFAGRETNDPRVLAGRAASSLAVGRVDEASADLDRAVQLDPKNSEALALQAIISLVQNDTDKARTLARKAVEADRQSTSGYIAQSYVQQAQFDLEGARSSLDKAVEVNADDALAWARLAELRSSLGEQDKALEAAKKAVALNPNLSRTQSVLGFAYLMQVKTHEAKEAFQKAIEFDQADALPRLGLGLAKIREWGGLEAGRADLEIAATLDPNNALVRSYLGKAFFEEKKDDLAEREFANAKELDPKDPTPYFYDALQKQLTNRPVEALEDMEKAMELNDNRAVYRSKLSLDSDLAARSSSLGRIYSNLGFQEQALVEGWNSVNRDQTSFTAHRFLADSYSVLPRHEIARVSELLKSQLLQPLNMTPIQPTLAVSNLFLLSALGPGSSSFNEFNTLLVNRDRLTVLGSGLVGNNDTQSGEGVIAGIYKNLSYSAGISNFHSDGWRSFTNQEDFNVNGFVQMELSRQISIQAEYRYRNLQQGDTAQRFWSDNVIPGRNNAIASNIARGGFKYEYDPHSIVLGSFIYNNSSEVLRDRPPNEPPIGLGPGGGPPFVPLVLGEIDGKTLSTDSYLGELQYLLRSQFFNLEMGGGYALQNGTPLLTLAADFSGIGGPPFSQRPGDPSPLNDDIRHLNGYAYGYFKLLKNLTITAGGSYDWIDGPSDAFRFVGDDVTQFNPKFGMIYNPLPETTIRIAAFRGMQRSLNTDQTIEPTQVAGFNQFFDDFTGTSAWNYGLAVQHKFKNHLTVGAEGTIRELELSTLGLNTGTREDVDGDEYHAFGYVFYTPHPWVALRGKFRWDKFKWNGDFVNVPVDVDTYNLPLGLGFFHPSGLLANLDVSWWKQDGKFKELSTFDTRSGDDDWWLVDASVGYRMPKRYGLITVGVKNLFDKNFDYYDTDLKNYSIVPDRMVFGQVTLALP